MKKLYENLVYIKMDETDLGITWHCDANFLSIKKKKSCGKNHWYLSFGYNEIDSASIWGGRLCLFKPKTSIMDCYAEFDKKKCGQQNMSPPMWSKNYDIFRTSIISDNFDFYQLEMF